ncbi:hypothetical protein [Nonomuraea jiangxiensis]|uniref:Uncharacterized protein n=1 Tax=Nonomuraea jiangxiensis TaxID=633440 RepID=A0A1G9PQQ6_9ACTN|nr:hypothetical protein [Nonomuraea jiangxiensis]SDM00415.1 hypothetical protein SAMN05421869_13449 [Nonomuraea jiangxiensis]
MFQVLAALAEFIRELHEGLVRRPGARRTAEPPAGDALERIEHTRVLLTRLENSKQGAW